MNDQRILGQFEDGTGVFLLEGTGKEFTVWVTETSPAPLSHLVKNLDKFKDHCGPGYPLKTTYMFRMGMSYTRLDTQRQKKVPTCGYVKRVFPTKELTLFEIADNMEKHATYKRVYNFSANTHKLATLLDTQVMSQISEYYK